MRRTPRQAAAWKADKLARIEEGILSGRYRDGSPRHGLAPIATLAELGYVGTRVKPGRVKRRRKHRGARPVAGAPRLQRLVTRGRRQLAVFHALRDARLERAKEAR